MGRRNNEQCNPKGGNPYRLQYSELNERNAKIGLQRRGT
jgi:hypothetical protein